MMNSTTWAASCAAVALAFGVGVAGRTKARQAQTSQNVSDLTLQGCLEIEPVTDVSSSTGATSQLVLTTRPSREPQTSGDSPRAVGTTGSLSNGVARTYIVLGEEVEQYAGNEVEVTGRLDPINAGSKKVPSQAADASGAAKTGMPLLQVQTIKKLSTKCAK
jgi:hypothetical protein